MSPSGYAGPVAGASVWKTPTQDSHDALEKLMEENTAGDPMSLLRWTNKSTTRIAEELTRQGHPASDDTVRRRLLQMDYSLQTNIKTKEGSSPADRDEQFRYINARVRKFLARSEPVLSVDTKKKERVGEFKNPGRTWRPKGKPQEVNVYDYPDLGVGWPFPTERMMCIGTRVS